MNHGVVFLNGNFLPLDEARISPYDRGFLFGDGLFETIRVKKGKGLFLEAHLRRLRKGAKVLNMRCSLSARQLSGTAEHLVRKNGITEGRLRITLTRGTSRSRSITQGDSPTVLVTLEHYSDFSRADYKRGCKIIISRFRVFSEDAICRVKSVDRLKHILAREEARRRGAFEALFLNEKNQIAECTVSNIFLVSGGILHTPPRTAGILEGTVRKLVMSLARSSGIIVRESALSAESLLEADEVFLTNSLFGVLSVCRVGARKVGKKVPGSVTRIISQLYRDAVLRELRI